MNLRIAIASTLDARRTAARTAPPPARLHRRPRDFGIGYGNSSGYASDKRYTRDWGNARFRFA